MVAWVTKRIYNGTEEWLASTNLGQGIYPPKAYG